ncbi:MAG TPA: TetR/AcrR family transcriptional regulator [Solirubrobacteraceae bacterium]|jgi:AcrR family transcriptional regulator
MAAERSSVREVSPWLRLTSSQAHGGNGIADIQRSRLVSAASSVVDELGCDGASVLRITARAGVSRRTFYEIFENRDECLLAAFERGLQQATSELAAAKLHDLPWRERIRGGLWVILCMLDREPALARLCVMHSLRGGPELLARRQQVLRQLIAVVGAGADEPSARSAAPTALTAEGVVGAVLAILHQRLSEERHEPLQSLLGELMGMIVLPYLGAQAARRERERVAPAPRSGPQVSDTPQGSAVEPAAAELLAQLPMRLTYRTARVLADLADHPGSNNREIAERVGVSDQGQISKLLARLLRLGLLVNAAERASVKGEPNEWSLTRMGLQITHTIGAQGRTGMFGARS